MLYHPYFYELSPLYVVQVALTIWMLVDANRRGVEQYWFWVILAAIFDLAHLGASIARRRELMASGRMGRSPGQAGA